MAGNQPGGESAYAVIVDPTAWTGDLDHLAEVVHASLAAISTGSDVPSRTTLLARLTAGAATVADQLPRGQARSLVDRLASAGAPAKLSRKRPAKGPAREQASKGPPRPEGVARPPSRKPPPATMMKGWARLTERPPAAKATRRPSPPTPPERPPSAQRAKVPARTERAPKPEQPATGPVMGWSDIIAATPPRAPGASEPGARPDALAQPPVDESASTTPALPALLLEPPAQDEATPTRADRAPTDNGGQPQDPKPDATKTGKPSEDVAPAAPPEERLIATPGLPPEMLANPLPGRPIPADELKPSPRLAALLSGLAPGAGQIYLGAREAALRYAMTAPLIMPWIDSVRDARDRAAAIAAGKRPPRARPSALRGFGFALLVWAVAAAVAVGCVFVYQRLTAPTPVSEAGANAPAVLDARQPEPAADAHDGEAANAGTGEALSGEVETRAREARARRLVVRAHEACEAGDYVRCSELAGQARELMPQLPEAVRLFHRARVALQPLDGSADGTGAAAQCDDGDCP